MGIETYVGNVGKGQSVLDGELEDFKNSAGEIEINPQEAQKLLADILYSFYRAHAHDPSIKIEVLRGIAEINSEEKVNFADSLKVAEREEEERRKRLDKIIDKANVIVPKKTRDLI